MSRRDSSRGFWRLVRVAGAAIGPCLLTLASVAVAGESRARVQLEVALAPGAVAGSEGLGYFVPEVARSFADALQKSGVTVAGPTELAASNAALHVTIEERSGDHVLLVARLRSHHVEVEAAVTQIEDLVADLASKVVPWCVELAPVAARPMTKNGKNVEPAPAHPATHATEAVAAPTSTGPVAPAPSSTSTPVVVTTAPTPTPTPVVAPAATAPATTPPLEPAPSTPIAPTPSTDEKPHHAVDPYGPDARVGEGSSSERGYIHGRAVVHTVLDPIGGYAGSGSAATQALYAVLQRRLHLSIVPMGAGVSVPSTAAEEGTRAQSRSVVMGRIDGYTIITTDPPAVRLRFEVVVVREGKLVMRRAVATETPNQALFAADGRRGRAVDPVYLAVARALESMLPELTTALASTESR